MVNVFQRLTRRATGSNVPENGTSGPGQDPNSPSNPHVLHRRNSTASTKRSRRHDYEAEEPVPRRLILISDTPEFDPEIIRRFRAEAFDVEYLPFMCTGDAEKDRKTLENKVHMREDDLETGERYAIVAYNRPAYYLLVSHHLIASKTNPFPRLCALIAYYPVSPTHIHKSDTDIESECSIPACSETDTIFQPGPAANFLPIQIHVPGEMESACTFWPWITVSSEGDVTYKKRHRCHVFTYPDSQPGFAEYRHQTQREKEDIPSDDVSLNLSWSRVLGCLRRAFGVGSNWPVVGIETVWEEYWQRILSELHQSRVQSGIDTSRSAFEIMGGRGEDQDEEGLSVECVPTKAGGTDPQTLRSFFKHAFIPAGPASQHIRLLSRTVGTDKIVDEIRFSFCHSAEVPWLLPGVQPTGRDISVNIVVVACFRAERIVRQSLYWDQADVLVQAGVLDSRLVPKMEALY
ncbi:uncharacterized protein N7484_008913 [Penicillium longicatenatum]|uniref:uncharacterized protein n=1 Tax=Penicillium longicatenatum TaxID=1561947 RepID=UPI0025467917|nr:uncharacterized protein N7484_008913 [Penicillium longicatenatum]KAJ5635600.1 hypothetical protein N7484_008913 [Penicillium longicatenatum]